MAEIPPDKKPIVTAIAISTPSIIPLIVIRMKIKKPDQLRAVRPYAVKIKRSISEFEYVLICVSLKITKRSSASMKKKPMKAIMLGCPRKSGEKSTMLIPHSK